MVWRPNFRALACLLFLFLASSAWAQQTCIQTGLTQEPLHPYKVGKYWDQGRAGACHSVAIINMNIDLFGENCDAGGALYRKVLDCMYSHGYTTSWTAGTIVPSATDDQLKECKRTALATVCQHEVNWNPYAFNPAYPYGSGTPGGFRSPPSGGGKSPCEKIKDALHPPNPNTPKAGVLGTVRKTVQNPDGSTQENAHAAQITEIDCNNGTIDLRDPNHPGTTDRYDVDKDGRLSNGSPSGDMNGYQISGYSQENPQ